MALAIRTGTIALSEVPFVLCRRVLMAVEDPTIEEVELGRDDLQSRQKLTTTSQATKRRRLDLEEILKHIIGLFCVGFDANEGIRVLQLALKTQSLLAILILVFGAKGKLMDAVHRLLQKTPYDPMRSIMTYM
jgi:hypothetical protein